MRASRFSMDMPKTSLLPMVSLLALSLSSCTTINLDGDHRRVESPPVFDLSIPLEEGSVPDPVLPHNMYEVSVCFPKVEMCP